MTTSRTLILLIVALSIIFGVTLRAEPTAVPSMAGQWVFTYKGEKRPFQFNENQTFSGRYPVSGKPFSGTWKLEGRKVLVFRNGKAAGDFGTITFRTTDECEYSAEGYTMNGHRAAR
jgi:hypothetical protein